MGIISAAFRSPRSQSGQVSSTSSVGWSPARLGAIAPSSKIAVDEDVALTYSAVFSAVSFITGLLASVSWGVFEKDGKDRIPLHDHAIDPLLRVSPDGVIDAYAWRRAMLAHYLLWGNAYAEIQFNGGGTPVGLHLIAPRRVKPKRDRDTSDLYYEIDNGKDRLPPTHMLHFRGLSLDGIVGLGPIRLAAESVATGLAQERFAGAFFGNDATPSTVFTHPGQMSEGAYGRLLKSIEDRFSGPNRKWRPFLAEEGIDVKTLTVEPESAQFLQSRVFQLGEIARWFRLPPHILGDMSAATFNNMETERQAIKSDALMPIARSLEGETLIKLVPRAQWGTVYTRLNLDGLVRGDMAARSSFYEVMTRIGVYSVNEVRAKEDMPPVDGGDKRYVQAQMIDIVDAGTPLGVAPERAASSLFGAVVSVLTRTTTKFEKASAKAVQRGELEEWLSANTEGHRQYVASELSPLARAIGQVAGSESTSDELNAAVEAFAREHWAALAASRGNGTDPDLNQHAREFCERIVGVITHD